MTIPSQRLMASFAFDPLGLHEGLYTHALLQALFSPLSTSERHSVGVALADPRTRGRVPPLLEPQTSALEYISDRRTWLGSNRIHGPPPAAPFRFNFHSPLPIQTAPCPANPAPFLQSPPSPRNRKAQPLSRKKVPGLPEVVSIPHIGIPGPGDNISCPNAFSCPPGP